MSLAEISEIRPGSISQKYGLAAGDRIVSVNGRRLRDILDYEISVAEERVSLEIVRDGKNETITIENPSLESLGIIFSTSLFDGIKTCVNKCVFCFVDQLPAGMRSEVYVKDDDYRLSFIYGNFVTLTNMRDEEIERVIKDRISPLYVSIHTTNPKLRAFMLGRKKEDKSLEYIKRLSDAGVEIHIQMVVCPGINDKDELDRSIKDLANGYGGVSSIGIVPVGLTGYRHDLYSLRSFEEREIMYLVDQARKWQAQYEKDKGCAWVYIADEFYIAGGFDLPSSEHYGEYPQIENGIGLSRLFIDEVKHNVHKLRSINKSKNIAIVTGSLFSNIMRTVADDLRRNYELTIDVVEVKNIYFGEKVNVTGLLTGSDIVASVRKWLEGNKNTDRILVPDVIFNGDGLTLDNYTAESIAAQLDSRVEIVNSSGAGFIEGLIKS